MQENHIKKNFYNNKYVYLEKKARSQINNLTLNLKKLEVVEQTKAKVRRMKITNMRVKMNED